MFKTILGLLPPLAGAVRVDGEPISSWNSRRRALTFGYVPQSGASAFPFTVREIVLMGRTAHRGAFTAPSAADREAAAMAINTLGIEHLAEREWARVSGGERQLALVARALAQEPRILVLDEPTASLDPAATFAVEGIIEAMHRAGCKIVMTTHDLLQARRLADEIVFLHHGRLLERQPADRFFANPATAEGAAFVAGTLFW